MSAIQVRAYQSIDLEPVLHIWNRALVRDPINKGRFVSSILCDADYRHGDDSGFLMAVEQGKPVGFLRAIVRHVPNDRLGIEPEHGWIPVIAVAPEYQKRGIGKRLLNAAMDFFRKHGRKCIWICGNTGSAPGYVFPGVDKDAYAPALRWLLSEGFVIDHEPVAMSREIANFDVDACTRSAWEVGNEVRIECLSPERVCDFFTFLAKSFPGDWNTAARGKVKSGALHEVLIALLDGKVIGYCQWEGEHFGPFGVAESARNKRVGAKLFTEAVRRIREADGRTVWFNWADPDAARFYQRFGLGATRHFAILRREI